MDISVRDLLNFASRRDFLNIAPFRDLNPALLMLRFFAQKLAHVFSKCSKRTGISTSNSSAFETNKPEW